MRPPTIDAYRDGAVLRFFCAYCRRDHMHGACGQQTRCDSTPFNDRSCSCPIGTGDGHRVAHCGDSSSPYYEFGYVLREITTPETLLLTELGGTATKEDA